MKPVVIVGGGLSGLSAGVELSLRNIPVVLLEQKPFAGGRAYSFTESVTGETVDNGQHVLLAGYGATLRFLGIIGTRDRLYIQPSPVLLFHHPVRGFRQFAIPGLPAPLHLVAAILTSDLLPAGDRLRMLRAARGIRALNGGAAGSFGGLTVEQWLSMHGQSSECRRSFWEPLAVSIMNEHVARASARVFVRTLHSAFLERRGDAALAIPTVGLSALYVDPALSLIQRKGGRVRCNADVERVAVSEGRVSGAVLRDGEVVECSACILSVPPDRVVRMLPDELLRAGYLSSLRAAPSSPIISLHLWFDHDFMSQPFLGLIGRRVQWIFNARRLKGGPGEGGHITAVISAAHEYVGSSNDELVRLAVEDLESVFRNSVGQPRHAVVIREKKATISCTPELEEERPDQQTPIPNLFLAGDWTDTGLPATIESAILSAGRCTELAHAWINRTNV